MKKKEERKIIAAFLLPFLITYVIFQLYPILLNIFYSLLNWNGITKTANFIGLENYKEIFSDGLFLNAVLNSILFAAAGTFFQVTVSFFLAYLVEYSGLKQKKLIQIVFIMPIVATPAAIGVIMKSIFNYDGFVNVLLSGIGLEKIQWFMEPKWTFVMLILITVWKETGTLFIYWIAGFQMVPQSVIEASKTDGATEFVFLKDILIPMMKPVLITVTGITFLNALKIFDLVQTLTAGGPYFSTDMISTYIYRTAFSSSFGSPRLSYASAAAVVCLVALVGISLLGKLVGRLKARGIR